MTKIKLHRGYPILALAAVLQATLLSTPAQAGELLAYVGPGAGLGMIGALLAVFAVVILALLGPILYPIRLFLRWYRRRNEGEATTAEVGEEASAPAEHSTS